MLLMLEHLVIGFVRFIESSKAARATYLESIQLDKQSLHI